MQKVKDYYTILGVSKDATKEQIKKVYRRLAKKYHPDLNKSPSAEERFIEINEAYSFLIQIHHKPLSEDETKGCHYHISPHKGEPKECRYCGKLFCERHIIPHPPKLGVGHGIPDEIHPCPDCPECPYCKNKQDHPYPYTDPYFDTVKHVFDYPYQCHKCKKWVTIDTRHPWQHDCSPEEKPTPTEKTEPPKHPEEKNHAIYEKAKKKPSKPTKIIMLAVILVIVIAAAGIFIFLHHEPIKLVKTSMTETATYDNNTLNVSRTELMFSKNISFGTYFENMTGYNGQDIAIVGHLKQRYEGTASTGRYERYAIDDYGNEILLNNLKSDQANLFTSNLTMEDIFNITGRFRILNKNLTVIVFNLTKI